MGPPIYIGGNQEPGTLQYIWESASMGPPIYIGGNSHNTSPNLESIFRFNGATDLHRWKLPVERIETFTFFKLQWGHRFTSVETRSQNLECFGEKSFNGATDLHRWKRETSFPTCGLIRGFNGATDLHRWKLAFNSISLPHRMASMGPPIYIGGNFSRFSEST